MEGQKSILSEVDQDLLSCKDLLNACKKGDALALEMVEQMAHYVGVCIYNIYEILNIDTYVFGGGLNAFGGLLFDKIRAVFDRYNHIDLPVEFRFAHLEKDFGVIGAAELLR